MSDDDPFDGGELEPVGSAKKGKGRASALARIGGGDEAARDIDLFLAWYDLNDIGNAGRLIKRFGDDLIHIPGKGWFVWDGTRWNGDAGADMALKRAQMTAQAMRSEVIALRDKKGGDASDRIAYLSAHVQQSGNVGRLKNMLIAAEPDLRRELDEIDSDPLLLYAPNAALRFSERAAAPERAPGEDDLPKDFERAAHRVVARERTHYVTKAVRAIYEAEARCPRWERFIAQIFPDESVRAFVQRAAGYSITGDMSEESFFMCWGRGRNGKGTFLRLLAHVLGTYAAVIPIELLLKQGNNKTGNEAAPQFAVLPGTRYVITSEPGYGVQFDEGVLKTLTGRDTIRIRDMYDKPFDTKPQFKLWIACNDKPSVRSSSDAFWRRVKLIPFVVNIAEEHTDKRLEIELQKEAAGILNWLLAGRSAWSEHGLAPPEAVVSANESYRDEMDPLHRFLAECTVLKPGGTLPRKTLSASYEEWCAENGEEPMKARSLGLQLSNKGYRRKHSNGVFYLDVGLSEWGGVYAARHEEKAKKPTGW